MSAALVRCQLSAEILCICVLSACVHRPLHLHCEAAGVRMSECAASAKGQIALRYKSPIYGQVAMASGRSGSLGQSMHRYLMLLYADRILVAFDLLQCVP